MRRISSNFPPKKKTPNSQIIPDCNCKLELSNCPLPFSLFKRNRPQPFSLFLLPRGPPRLGDNFFLPFPPLFSFSFLFFPSLLLRLAHSQSVATEREREREKETFPRPPRISSCFFPRPCPYIYIYTHAIPTPRGRSFLHPGTMGWVGLGYAEVRALSFSREAV